MVKPKVAEGKTSAAMKRSDNYHNRKKDGIISKLTSMVLYGQAKLKGIFDALNKNGIKTLTQEALSNEIDAQFQRRMQLSQYCKDLSDLIAENKPISNDFYCKAHYYQQGAWKEIIGNFLEQNRLFDIMLEDDTDFVTEVKKALNKKRPVRFRYDASSKRGISIEQGAEQIVACIILDMPTKEVNAISCEDPEKNITLEEAVLEIRKLSSKGKGPYKAQK